MKRSTQLQKAGTPSAGQRSRFRGFRKQWREGEPPIETKAARRSKRKEARAILEQMSKIRAAFSEVRKFVVRTWRV